MVHALIMAGGVGSRFWPKSKEEKPKQFLSFFEDERTLIQTTIERIKPLIPLERIIVSTNARYVDLVREQIPELPEENIIGEPVAKNTAPCIAFAASLIHYRDPDAAMVVLPSDHYIRENDIFINDINTCIKSLDEDSDRLVTLGIVPNRPETGYGYIQYDDSNLISIDEQHAYPVKTFAEKPDMQTAIKFLQSGDFLWNSGMFIWKCKKIFEQIQMHLPVLYHQTQVFSEHLKKNDGKIKPETLKNVYESCFSVSIDFGIMEKSDNVIVIPSNFHWSDLGSWMSIYEIHKNIGDKDGNVLYDSDTITVNSQNCYLNVQTDKKIALVGLHGIGVIETDDSLLICKLEKSQDVKQVFDLLPKKSK